MSMTVHFTQATALAVGVFENDDVGAGVVPDVYGADTAWEQDVLRLVLEDAGSCYGVVIEGTDAELLKLAADIVTHVATKTAPS